MDLQLFLPFTLLLLFYIPWTFGQFPCPPPDDISPCTCEYYAPSEIYVDCSSATSSEIFSVFNDVPWLTKLTAFTVLNSDGLTELPQGVFGDVSFQYIDVYDAWNLMTIHPEAILQSKDRLQGLHIYGGILHDFPWYIVPQLTNITSLGISSNALTTVPVLESSALQYLFLGENHISTLEVGWNTPNLNYLDLSYNPISELPTGFFDGLENIVAFDCISCKLGPILAAGSMEFPGATLEYLYLFHNNITFVEPGAITGLTAHAHLDLWGNEIEELTEESFRPILEDLSLGNGHIDLFDNPIQCVCSMAWIVLNPDFLTRVHGQCQNGPYFNELDPSIFETFCIKMNPPMPGDYSTWLRINQIPPVPIESKRIKMVPKNHK